VRRRSWLAGRGDGSGTQTELVGVSGRRVLIEREWGNAADPGMKSRIHFTEGPHPVAEVSGNGRAGHGVPPDRCAGRKTSSPDGQPDDEAGVGPVAVHLVDQCVDQARGPHRGQTAAAPGGDPLGQHDEAALRVGVDRHGDRTG